MADGALKSAPNMAESHNSDIALRDSIDVMDRNLKQDDDSTTSENQLVIRDSLRLQRDLLQLNLAVPVKFKVVEKSIRDFRGFYNTQESDTEAKNGESPQQSILSLLESVATSASTYAKQLRNSKPSNRDSSSSPNSQQKRETQRTIRKQKRQQQIDELLERVSRTPIELMFGVRIRRKYANEIMKRYGMQPQPYYADLSDSDSITSSEAFSSDESLLDKIGINSTRINGVNTANKKANNGITVSPSTLNSINKKTQEGKKRKKQTSAISDTKSQSRKGEAIEMLNWLDLMRKEEKPSSVTIPGSDLKTQPKKADAIEMLNWYDIMQKDAKNEEQSRKTTTVFKDDSSSIPPEAMEILKEALVSAAQNNSDEHLNEETARILATNFIQATAASAAASRMNQGGTSSEIMPSSSSTNTDIPGLSQDAAVEVWKEIQQYLRNLCLSNTAAQELAAKTAESLKSNATTPRKDTAPSSKPLADLPLSTNLKAGKKKRKTKGIQASPYPESVLERRRELLRLQAEKQQEHAKVVKQLKEQEAKLRDAVLAAASAQRSWINYKPVEMHPFKVGSGPYGATYQHEDFIITAHHEWLNERMIARGLRVYILIRAFERHRLYDYCEVRRREARFCIFLHCDKYRDGFLTYICGNNEKIEGDIAFYDTQCEHTPKWSKLEWSRMCNYHARFYAVDKKLPMLAGDFYFLMNQIHSAYESVEQYYRYQHYQRLKRLKDQALLKRHPLRCDCFDCTWERNNISEPFPPLSVPFDPRQHNIELFLPTNYVLSQPVGKQRRLLKNQAQLAEKCIVVTRNSIADEERKWSAAKSSDQQSVTEKKAFDENSLVMQKTESTEEQKQSTKSNGKKKKKGRK